VELLGAVIDLLERTKLMGRTKSLRCSGVAVEHIEFYPDAPHPEAVESEVKMLSIDEAEAQLARDFQRTMYGASADPDFPELDG